MQDEFPEATLTVDRFHVMKLIGDAVDNVRRRERRCRDKRKRDLLDGTRYIWLKNREKLTDRRQRLMSSSRHQRVFIR